MECQVIGPARVCLDDKHVSQSVWKKCTHESIHMIQCHMAPLASRIGYTRLPHSHCGSSRKRLMRHILRKNHAMPVTMIEESSSVQSQDVSNYNEGLENSSLYHATHPLSSGELKSLLADSEMAKLLKKLSEANQQNRFLKRQLLITENALDNFKGDIAVMEFEMQTLLKLAEEISQYGIPVGSRKINGKYIQSHILSRLEGIHKKLKKQIVDVAAAQSKEVPLLWCGMAESVQVMGTFDGWSEGEHLSPEYTGSFPQFSTTLMLRPGRYEIKFLIDGEWHLSPELPTTGEGLMQNNLLIVT